MDHFKTVGRRKVVGHTFRFVCPCCNKYLRMSQGKKKLRRTTRRVMKQEKLED